MFIGRISICIGVLFLAFSINAKVKKKRFIINFKKQESIGVAAVNAQSEIVFASSKEEILESFQNVESVDEDIMLSIDYTPNDVRFSRAMGPLVKLQVLLR